MILIGGVSPKLKQVGPAQGTCAACGRQGSLHVIKQAQMISLFFIPVIPVGSSYMATCPHCASLMEVDKAAGKAVEAGRGHVLNRADLRVVKNNVGVRCPRCHHRVDAGQNYCPNCGEAL